MFRNRILYFRHDDWRALCEPLIDRLTKFTFKRMDPVRIVILSGCSLLTNTLGPRRSSPQSAEDRVLVCSAASQGSWRQTDRKLETQKCIDLVLGSRICSLYDTGL
jgi:hypothetical protein